MSGWLIPPETDEGGTSPVIAYFTPANDLVICENLTARRKILEVKFAPDLGACFNPEQKAEIAVEVVRVVGDVFKHPLLRLAEAAEDSENP